MQWQTDLLHFTADTNHLDIQLRLDELGAEGWEPVGMALSDGLTLYVLLKRLVEVAEQHTSESAASMVAGHRPRPRPTHRPGKAAGLLGLTQEGG